MRHPVIVKSSDQVATVLRGDREALGLTGEELDARIGWADRYTAKAENPSAKWGKHLIRIEDMAEYWLISLNRSLVLMDRDHAETLVRTHASEQPQRGLERVRVHRFVFAG
jgi:hypothetical protein